MPLREVVETVAMLRVAIVAPADGLRAALVELADSGTTELEVTPGADSSDASEALRRLRTRGVPEGPARLAGRPLTESELESAGRADLLAGEVELQRRASAGRARGSFVVLVGWCPRDRAAEIRSRLEPLGAGVVELERPPYVDPPTLLRTPRAAEPFKPLVETYGAVRYGDVDPTPFTAISFVLMFGMMFADAGHGILLAAAGLALRFLRQPRLAPLRKSWVLPFAAGLVATAFGVAYGEFFGPTGVVPVLWLEPLQNPLELLIAGVLAGAVLLAVSYVIGTVNRWREGGSASALLSSSGVAGSLVFAGVGTLAASIFIRSTPVLVVGAVIMAAGLVFLFLGFLLDSAGGVAGWLEAIVETVNSLIRIGANSVSFARLAAFGMVHAAIGSLVWTATVAMAASGWWVVAVLVFVVGNAAGFTLELVVAGIQALRLEYYELFSRIYSGEGRPFEPWRLTVIKEGS
jgi:V/A-type H+/Na+-transporting ATPase subunit I